MISETAMVFLKSPLCVRSRGFFLLADLVEDADEAALVALEHGHETAQRIGERADELREKFDLGRQRSQHGDLLGVDELTVDVGSLDAELFAFVGELLERLRRRDWVDAAENDSGRPGEKLVQLGRKFVTRGAAEKRVLDD